MAPDSAPSTDACFRSLRGAMRSPETVGARGRAPGGISQVAVDDRRRWRHKPAAAANHRHRLAPPPLGITPPTSGDRAFHRLHGGDDRCCLAVQVRLRAAAERAEEPLRRAPPGSRRAGRHMRMSPRQCCLIPQQSPMWRYGTGCRLGAVPWRTVIADRHRDLRLQSRALMIGVGCACVRGTCNRPALYTPRTSRRDSATTVSGPRRPACGQSFRESP